ncbi:MULTISPECIES: ABC transporter substrate-binding protein [Bradyrhizobium]|uniref:ABC-type transport system, substrate-binding protein n=2 Tax=Bradyrhizobium TaxID=374 RepID=A0ABY0PM27_9BRAD|nr:MULTISPECIES: ABC transporter substrate-binding protein [Bradyrhizobium]SDI63269.1 ABC-type transport system, substrate-binding protein [Bradyrhizobium ottawaense]SED34346.1 ABC-type transport system, substrate-binding protein [Bradyrhizobium lablabi]
MAFFHRRDLLRALGVGGLAVSPVGRSAFARDGNKRDAKRGGTEPVDAKQSAAKQIVIGKQTSDLSGFDPHLNVSASAAEIIGNLYETLIALKDGKPLPGLAEWAEPNGSLWTFTIKANRQFASKNPIKAADAAFSLQRALRVNSSPSHPLAQLGLTPINADRCIRADDGQVLTIKLPETIEKQIVLHCLTSACCSILDSELVKHRYSPTAPAVVDAAMAATTCRYAPLELGYSPGLGPPDACQLPAPFDSGEAWLRFNSAGSGPFLIRNAERTEEVVLRRNFCHPGYDKSNRLPLIVRDIADPREQQRLLRSGEIQVAWNLAAEPPVEGPAVQVSKDAKQTTRSTGPAIEQVKRSRANLLLLCMNVTKTPLDKPEVRKAMRRTIDNDLLKQSLMTQRWDAQSRFFPSAIGGFDVKAPRDPDDEADRKTLESQKCSLKLDYLAGAGRSTVANGLASQLSKVGVKLALDPASSGRIFQERLEKREFDLALVSLSSDYLHPHSNAQALCSNSDLENSNTFDGPHTLAWHCHWVDGNFMDAVAYAAKEPDPAKQLNIYQEIQNDLFDSGPYVFLLEETAFVKGVKGSLPLLGALDNLTRYSPPKPT